MQARTNRAAPEPLKEIAKDAFARRRPCYIHPLMNPVRATLLSLLACLALRAGEPESLPGAPADSIQNWMHQNIEDWAFDMAGIDRESLDQSVDRVEQTLEAAALRDPTPCRADADQVLLALRKFDEARSCAAWLEAFLDHPGGTGSVTNAVQTVPAQPSPREMYELWLTLMTNRPAPVTAADYLVQLKPIFRAEKVPAELVWVAEVESAFDPHAQSPVGAVGLFQLMPATAQSLGLSTWLPDDRRNAEKNARAAAKDPTISLRPLWGLATGAGRLQRRPHASLKASQEERRLQLRRHCASVARGNAGLRRQGRGHPGGPGRRETGLAAVG